MKLLILAAGYGTRLYPLTKDNPKALLTVNNKPLLNLLLDKVGAVDGLTEVIVVSNDKFYPVFQLWANDMHGCAVPVTILNDGTKTNEDRLGSIGDIDFAVRTRRIDEDILVAGGDNLFDFGLSEYIAYAREKRPHVTVGLFDIKEKERAKIFGVVKLDAQQRIESLEEKPAQPKSSLISMCLYYLPRESFGCIKEYLAQTKSADAAGGYIRWLADREPVYGFSFSGSWYDIGSIEAYEQAQKDFAP